MLPRALASLAALLVSLTSGIALGDFSRGFPLDERHTEGPVSVGEKAVLRDALGSLTGYATASASSYQPVRTDEWGKNLAGAATDDCPLCSVNNGVPGQSLPTLAYAGQHAEPGVGLLYAQQRWYDPKLGMFLSVDPVQGDLSNPNGLQLWGYANGNPLRYVEGGTSRMRCADSLRAEERINPEPS